MRTDERINLRQCCLTHPNKHWPPQRKQVSKLSPIQYSTIRIHNCLPVLFRQNSRL